MDEQFNSLLSIVIIPQVADLIVKKETLDDISALTGLYLSKTYDALENEETKVWHFSPLTIYMMWKNEKKTGEVLFPEK